MDPPLTPFVLGQGLFALVLLPELCARLVLRAFAADVRVEDGALRIAGALQRVELARGALERVAAVAPAAPERGALAARCARARGSASGSRRRIRRSARAARAGGRLRRRAPGDAASAFARARAAWPRRWWDRPLVKIGLASLVPGAIGFNAHQHIAFGGLPRRVLPDGPRRLARERSAATGRTGALYLVLWAGCFRVAVETLAWLGTRPRTGARGRRAQRGRTLGRAAVLREHPRCCWRCAFLA